MNIRIVREIKRDGWRYTLVRSVAKIFGVQIGIKRLKDKGLRRVIERHGYQVAYGPFMGMQLNPTPFWHHYDLAPQILGTYEEHVTQKLVSFAQDGAEGFIDIGAADGYFAVGMSFSKIFHKVYAFEIADAGRQRILQNAGRNRVSTSLIVRSEADVDSVREIVQSGEKWVVLIDIEGAEFDLLSMEMLSVLCKCSIVVELHPWLVNGGEGDEAELIQRASSLFDVKLMRRETYRPNDFREFDDFSDEERLVVLGEGRQKNMRWMVLTPKQ